MIVYEYVFTISFDRSRRAVSCRYRVYYSNWQALASLFYWHNETLNVWTHLLGFLYIVYLFALAMLKASNEPEFTPVDIFILCLFYCSTCFCLGSSFVFHLYSCVSPACYSCLYRVDMSGICLMILSSYIPGLYFAFYCNHTVSANVVCLVR